MVPVLLLVAPMLSLMPNSANINRTVEIAPGVEMPIVNFGLCDHKQVIAAGGRGFDTAFSYGDNDQRDVGQTVRDSGLNRSDIFVLSKIPCCPATQFWGIGTPGCNNHRNPADDLQHDMDMLGLKFVDLMLIHWPCDRMEDNVGTYKQLEKFVQAGKARAIGVSNFNGDMLDELVKQTSIKPAVNQVGFSIGNHAKQSPASTRDRAHWGCDDGTLAKCRELGTTLMAFSPLGGHGFYDVFHDKTVGSVGQEVNRSAAQVGLRWLAQQGIPFVTSSNNPDHIKSDFEIFEFDLSPDQMARLSGVNPH